MNGEESGMKTFLTKWVSFLFFFINLNLFAKKASENSYILEVKKESSIFQTPSARSKIIAKADQGTYLIFLETSKRGLWVKVQDSDGQSGWIPKNRTDFEEIENRNKHEADSFKPEEKNKKEESELRSEFFETNRNYRLSSFYRKSVYSPESRFHLGLRFDWKLPTDSFRSDRGNGYIVSAEVSTQQDFQHLSKEFGGAVRLGRQVSFLNWLFYVPDYGYSFEKTNGSLNHHFSLGLSAGVDIGRLDLRTRFGYNFFSKSYASVEVQLGCWF